ncbi:MAG: hypothetical protein L3J23_07875 [Flavobacteriaceae bacterium]|nr:hypothetical protein [Flavobacteriaceae bacterium]
MINVYKFFELGYLVIAVFFIIQAVLKFATNPKKAGFFLLFAIISIFMYFFKKWFRKNRFEKKK